MAFMVLKEFTNGYRCGCCGTRDWGDPEWVPSEPEARAMFDAFLADHDRPRELYDDCEWVGIEVTDGATGEKIAEGTLAWSPERKQRYKTTALSGHWRDEHFQQDF